MSMRATVATPTTDRDLVFEDLVTNPFQNEYFYAKTCSNPQNFIAGARRTQFCAFCIQYCSCYNAKALFFIIHAEGANFVYFHA